MSRTIKDQNKLLTIPNVWEILRREDGTFDMFHNSELSCSSVPDQWLEDQLGQYGICGEEYKDIRCQLDESGKAKIVF
jgi:hypothetical protein